MKTIFCLALSLASAFCADPILRFQSVPHIGSPQGIRPGLMPGVAGVGLETTGLPCSSCFEAPTGSVVLPPPQYIIVPAQQAVLTFYYTVETGNTGGAATSSFQVTENGSGAVVLSNTASVTLAANSTNILSFSAQLPDLDGYKGLENVAFTTKLGNLTVQDYTHVWVSDPTSGTSADGIHPNLMPGVAGVGIGTPGLPCVSCFGAPAGSLIVPPAYVVIAPDQEPGLIFYYAVETGTVSGLATASFDVVESTTGKVASHGSFDLTVPANSTTFLYWDTGLPDGDGYKGLEDVVYTTVIGSLTVQDHTHIWVVHHTAGG